jgi:hypothetical protein
VGRRFVVQRHEVKPGDVHFDFMVESGDKLATFRLDAGPGSPPPLRAGAPGGGASVGTRSFDHRLLYLEYEGEISGGRGTVAIVERGVLDDVHGDPSAERYVFRIGERLYELAGAGTEGAPVSLRAVD